MLATAGDALVAKGLPDPRGCEWHDVTFVVDGRPLVDDAGTDRARSNSFRLPYPTAAWVLPGGALGFSTDGVIRRIARIGAARRFDESKGLHGTLAAIYAERSGYPDVAARLLREEDDRQTELTAMFTDTVITKPYPTKAHSARDLEDIGWCEWLDAEHKDIADAFHAGADQWTLTAAQRTLEHLASAHDTHEGYVKRTTFLRQLAGDAFRRLHESARPSLANLTDASPTKRHRSLVALLETVKGVDGIKDVADPDDPAFVAIECEGMAILPALTEVIARDQRLARGGDATFGPLTVARVANQVMERIFDNGRSERLCARYCGDGDVANIARELHPPCTSCSRELAWEHEKRCGHADGGP